MSQNGCAVNLNGFQTGLIVVCLRVTIVLDRQAAIACGTSCQTIHVCNTQGLLYKRLFVLQHDSVISRLEQRERERNDYTTSVSRFSQPTSLITWLGARTPTILEQEHILCLSQLVSGLEFMKSNKRGRKQPTICISMPMEGRARNCSESKGGKTSP